MKRFFLSHQSLRPAYPASPAWTIRFAVVSLLFALNFGCSRPNEDLTEKQEFPVQPIPTTPQASLRFVDVAPSSGVSWTAHNGEESQLFSLLESFGSGCALDDYDRDERLDIFLAGGGKFSSDNKIEPLPLGLFRQTSDWQFKAVAAEAGVERACHYHHGLWTVDHDEDGFADVLVTGWEGLQLFHNEGDGTFSDVTALSGLNDSTWSLAAAWADLNHDQILDLFVGHYVDWSMINNPVCNDRFRSHRSICDPSRFKGLPCTIHLGQGDGTYRDASAELGVNLLGKTLGVVIADLNDDSRPDIYVANDTVPNQLYESLPNGGFAEVAISHGVAFADDGSPDGSMGVDAGDIDGDGRVDLWVANYEKQSFAFYRSLGPEMFSHASRVYGVTAVGADSVGFGTVIFDADGDGRSDVFCTNGHIFPPTFPVERRQLPYLFWNDGRRLWNVAATSGDYLQQRHLGRGAAVGDLDANGTPDLVVTHTNEPVAVLRNESSIEHWLAVRLVGSKSPRSGIGARVILVTDQKQQVAIVKGGGSYLSTSDRTVLFGLGDSANVQSVEVHWPSGRVTLRENIASNQQLIVMEQSLSE